MTEHDDQTATTSPGTVHLVGIDAVAPDPYDMDDSGSPQKVMIALADRGDAQRWADRHNAMVPWSPETKVVVLVEIPYVPAGSPAPEPETQH